MKGRVELVEQPTLEGIKQQILDTQSRDDAHLLIVAEGCSLDIPSLLNHVKGKSPQLAGCVVPGVIFEDKLYRDAALLLQIPVLGPPVVVPSLNRPRPELPVSLRNLLLTASLEGATLLIFIDGLTRGISEFLQEISKLVGARVACLGGGSGSLEFAERRCVFSREGVFRDAAVVVPLRSKVAWGVRHGVRRIGPVLIASRTSLNRIRELNWQVAFDVYQRLLQETQGETLSRENFLRVSPRYPLGILREMGEALVRDPIGTDPDGALVCVGSIPENSAISLMVGEPDSLLQACADCVTEAASQCPTSPALCFVFDCVSREMILGNRFSEELTSILTTVKKLKGNVPTAGFLSFGEIAPCFSGWASFYNKTVVVAFAYDEGP